MQARPDEGEISVSPAKLAQEGAAGNEKERKEKYIFCMQARPDEGEINMNPAKLAQEGGSSAREMLLMERP